MKVLLLTSSFPPEVRSQSTLMHELALDLAVAGHQVTVVTGVPRYNLPDGVRERYKRRLFARETVGGVEVLRLPVFPVPRRVPLLRGLEQLLIAITYAFGSLIKGRPDVTLVYSPPLPLGLSAYVVSKLYGAPFILNVQDIYPQTAIDLGLLKNPALIAMAERMERFVYRRASMITTHSEGNREVLGDKGVAPEKVVVIPNWVDTEQIRPEQRSNGFRESHALGDKFVVSFTGIMGFAQGLETVLNAAHILREHQDILFLMVGDGSLKDVLVAQARELGLPNTKFLPMQPQKEYPHVLAASDVSLVSLGSRVRTPVVPAKLMSIMASGRAVVATVPADGDTPRIINEARCGICTPPGDPEALARNILELYRNPEEATRLGQNGRTYAEAHFSRVRCVAQYEALLESVVAARSSKK